MGHDLAPNRRLSFRLWLARPLAKRYDVVRGRCVHHFGRAGLYRRDGLMSLDLFDLRHQRFELCRVLGSELLRLRQICPGGDDRDKHAHWDLKVVDSKGNSIEWNDLNLVEISEVTLHYKDGKAWADVK